MADWRGFPTPVADGYNIPQSIVDLPDDFSSSNGFSDNWYL
jgi:hypothetical protein